MLGKEFQGKWRIVLMDRWDSKCIDLIEPGYIKLLDNGFGSFHFGHVYANMDTICMNREK
jgi:hypothetical protein